jgi:FkbM family methyltransferase
MRRPSLASSLRRTRAVLAKAIAGCLDHWPAAEPAYIRIGIAARRSRWAASLYWHSHEALAARLRPGPRRYRQLDVEGLQLALDITNYTASMRYFHHQPYEPDVTRIVASLRPGEVFIDVGANVGLFTLIGARRVRPGGRVIAFEPHPDARREMRALLERNGVADMVEIVPAAVSDVAIGAARLFITSDPVLSTLEPAGSPLAGDFEFHEFIDVELTSVDAWVARNALDPARIRLVKIDVEGGEDAVVGGMAGTLARAPRVTVVCETVPGSAADRLLVGAGFAPRPLELRRGDFGNYVYER